MRIWDVAVHPCGHTHEALGRTVTGARSSGLNRFGTRRIASPYPIHPQQPQPQPHTPAPAHQAVSSSSSSSSSSTDNTTDEMASSMKKFLLVAVALFALFAVSDAAFCEYRGRGGRLLCGRPSEQRTDRLRPGA